MRKGAGRQLPHPGPLLAVRSHFPSPLRSVPAVALGKQKASYEQEAQGQLLILKTVLICLCLISLLLMRRPSAADQAEWLALQLTPKLIRSTGEADSSAISLCDPCPLWLLPKDGHSSLGLR